MSTQPIIDIPTILYSTEDAAYLVGCVPQTIRKYCLKYGIGTHVGPEDRHGRWILTEDDITALRAVREQSAARFSFIHNPHPRKRKVRKP